MAPGSTVTSATEMAVETLKFETSAILTDPPESGVAAISENLKTYGDGTWPCGSDGAVALDNGGSDDE